LDEVLVLTGLDVQTLTLRSVADLVDDDRALEARVVRELPHGLLERAEDDGDARPLVTFERVELDRVDRVHERNAAAGNDTLLECGTSRLECVLDAVLLLLHLRLGRSA